MSPSLTTADRLRQRFNLLPEQAEGSELSINEELINAVISGEYPDLEQDLNTNPDSTDDPEQLYIKIVSGLSIALFEPTDIQKIISAHVRGDLWEKWNDGERELFISEHAEKARSTDEKKKLINDAKKRASLAYLTKDMGVFYNALADMCIEKFSLKTLDGGDLRIYEDGIYPEISNKYTLNNLVMKTSAELGIMLTPNRITSTIEMIKTKTPYNPPEDDFNKIAVSNGVLDVVTLDFVPQSPDIVFLHKMPVEYNPDAAKPELFLKSLSATFKGVENQIPTLQELFGYCLLRKYPIASVFFLLGDGKNGKSVILKLMTAMLGDENTSGLTLSDMAQPKNEHVLIDLRGKHANICGDVGKKKIDDTAFLKMLTGRDPIRARGLYKDAITFVNYAKAIFALNQLPVIDDFSDGFKRRIKIIEFPNKFDGKEEIAELDEAIIKAGELSGILNWSLEGLHRLLKNNKFSNEKTAAEAGLDYDMRSNPVSYFVRACIDEDITNVERTETVLGYYMDYRKRYRLPTLSKKEFKGKLIEACKEIGISTYEKRERPPGGANADRYYGFAGIRVNKADLKKSIGEHVEDQKKEANTEIKNKQLITNSLFSGDIIETDDDAVLEEYLKQEGF
ncbi:DNA primase family protein [Methanosarcina mazei]|uniref:SF3 helicase domain-containing protein n=1 Tax=Methanosarcina mazei TaxID=2209 RepID=A0A0F8GA76_METMZ|nr:phage/plasmid primase, P4 family [Methanosarcina mazei]KKG49233.1 hypothetical protein DU33_16110 [Methanosarcina mazei]KKG62232.1 hypothetical protein DU45_19050 [Methanosarcina mazei]KKG66187.1 hypothetical protein DU64_15315 [Methanosarcina mazei]